MSESRRDFLRDVGIVAGGLATGGFAIYKYGEAVNNSQPKSEAASLVHHLEPGEAHDMLLHEGKPLVKVVRGEIQITKNPGLRIRQDSAAPAKEGNNSSYVWSDIKSINGVDIENAVSFTVINAPLVMGETVDARRKEPYWLKFAAELTTGEKRLIYISMSAATSDTGYIYSVGTKQEPLQKDWGGNIIEPHNGLGKVWIPSTSLKKPTSSSSSR